MNYYVYVSYNKFKNQGNRFYDNPNNTTDDDVTLLCLLMEKRAEE